MGATLGQGKKEIKLLDRVIIALTSIGGTNSTIQSTLTSILSKLTSTQDVEILLVRDLGDNSRVIQQIRTYNQGTNSWTTTFEKVDGTPHTVLGALEYLDSSSVLNLILTELQLKSNLFRLKNESSDLVKTLVYYTGVIAGNPSGSVSNVKTVTYSSVLLGISAMETLTYDTNDNVLTVTLA